MPQLAKTKTRKIIPIGVYPKQSSYCNSKERIAGFVGGRGCGKSEVGAIKCLKRAKGGRFYMCISDILPRMKDSTIKSFLSVARRTGQYIKYNQTEHLATFRTQDGGQATIRFRPAEDPEAMRGPNISGLWVDEASLVPHDSYLLALAMCREAGEMAWVDLTFTPKGLRHWTYSVFFDEDGNPKKGTHLVQARSDENPFLPEQFADELRGNYTTQLARQEIEGLFVELAGFLFQREWFEIVDRAPAGCQRVRYWDKASTPGDGCYTAGVLMAVDRFGTFYIEHVIRGQWSPNQRNQVMLQTAQMDAKNYGNVVRQIAEQEGGSGGVESALFTVRLLNQFPVAIDKVTGKSHKMKMRERLPGEAKVVRALPLAAQAEQGNVKIVAGTWNRDYLDEVSMFPEYKYSDQMDGSSGAYNHLAKGSIIGPVEKAQAVSHTLPELSSRGIQMRSILSGDGPGRYGIRFNGKK